jgi:glycerol-1-phosphate dehydrogenase [NAD(P)+]
MLIRINAKPYTDRLVVNYKLKAALAAANETESLLIAQGALSQTATMFREHFDGKKAIIVADETTWSVAGRDVSEILSSNGVLQDEPFVFADTELYAEYRHIDRLEELFGSTDAIPIAVGSGTINDLVKLASHLAGRRYMVAGTAASMDGYTSFGASITANGAKQTFECPAPKAVLADLDIIAAAPPEMTAAGYADLFSKITAGADWILADALGIEPVEAKAWSIVQDGLPDALADPEEIRKGDRTAIGRLVEGLMLAGFAMQCSSSSRPASGAEHYLSHLWDMQHHKYNGKYVSHGFQVGIGTLAMIAFYEQFLKNDMSLLDVKLCKARWMSLEDVEKAAVKTFGKTVFIDRIMRESRAKYDSPEQVGHQLRALKDNWSGIKRRLEKQLIPFEEARLRLQAVGAPSEPEQIGIDRERLRETMIGAPMIRNRFTVLDLAQRAGLTDKCLAGMFGNH